MKNQRSSKKTRLSIWLTAARPRTLPAALAPVIMGTAAAFGRDHFHALSALMALLGALLIQIGTNLVNDYADYAKGADTEERIGPMRVTQAGLVSAASMKRAVIIVFGLVLLPGAYLVYRGGWPLVVVGVLSILSGIFYTAGPRPFGYMGLGDLFVLIFFGPVAVAGTYYVQALTVDWIIIAAGFAPGFLSVAILAVNNLRDIDTDRKSGKRTLAVRFGREFARREYFYCIVLACIIPTAIHMVSGQYPYTGLVVLTLFFAAGPLGTVFSDTGGPALNRTLARTGKLLLIYGLLFSVGWLL